MVFLYISGPDGSRGREYAPTNSWLTFSSADEFLPIDLYTTVISLNKWHNI